MCGFPHIITYVNNCVEEHQTSAKVIPIVASMSVKSPFCALPLLDGGGSHVVLSTSHNEICRTVCPVCRFVVVFVFFVCVFVFFLCSPAVLLLQTTYNNYTPKRHTNLTIPPLVKIPTPPIRVLASPIFSTSVYES